MRIALLKDAFTGLEVLAYCSKSIMVIINHLHTLPKEFKMINVLGNLPYLIQPHLFQALSPKLQYIASEQP